jgi:hypothetical protein
MYWRAHDPHESSLHVCAGSYRRTAVGRHDQVQRGVPRVPALLPQGLGGLLLRRI